MKIQSKKDEANAENMGFLKWMEKKKGKSWIYRTIGKRFLFEKKKGKKGENCYLILELKRRVLFNYRKGEMGLGYLLAVYSSEKKLIN